MTKKRTQDDPVFLLRGDDGEIYFIDDLNVIHTLEAKVTELEGKSDDEIGRELLAIVNPERYGNDL